MSLQDKSKKLKTVSLGAVFLGISVIISIVESVSGINAAIPMPGVKLGFCNIAITACLYICGVKAALAVSLLRPLFLFMFSANPVSLAMSYGGTVLSFASLIMTKKLYGKVSMGVVRTTFIIDENGMISKIMPKVKPDTNASEILAELR